MTHVKIVKSYLNLIFLRLCNNIILNIIMLPRRLSILRIFSRQIQQSTSGSNQGSSGSPPPASSSSQVNTNVPGLSSAVVNPATQPVGPNVDPNKTGAYKSPEYFCYHNMSYFEAEIEMQKFRVAQPSALKK